MAPLATARSYHSCTAIGTQLFVVGGHDSFGRDIRTSVEMYDSNTDQWQAMEEAVPFPVETIANAAVCELLERPSRCLTSQ